jgi:neutral ceramidase
MQVGVSQIDITPSVGVELCGYLARVQPSVGLIDPLYAKGLYLEKDGNPLMWVHADLIAFDHEQVIRFRNWARQEMGLSAAQVVLSATHTHAGPATIQLTNCGRMDPEYLRRLDSLIREAALRARQETRQCRAVTVEVPMDLAIDRRNKPSAHTDPRALGVGLLADNGDFAAVVVNYAMHPVALGAGNRMISTDYCGPVAAALTERLPGQPVVLVTNGACGNLNPPAKGVPPPSLEEYGRMVADALVPALQQAQPHEPVPPVSHLETVSVPLDVWDEQTVASVADHYLQSSWLDGRWKDPFAGAIRTWQQSMIQGARHQSDAADLDLQVIRLGDVHLVAVPAEIFSWFTAYLRERTGKRVYTLGYANGCFGYIPHAAAYDEGGYEVETAHFFYNHPRVRVNGLELLVDQAARIIGAM